MRPSPAPVPDRPHILVVDDEGEIRDLLQSVLEREGYRVTTHEDGARALAALGRIDATLLITDLRMPCMGGLELVRAARGIRPDLATIVVTAFASTESAVEAMRFGVDDFLTKPFEIEELRSTVQRVLGARRLLADQRDALLGARDEADRLRASEQAARRALGSAQVELATSRQALERRVRDLAFVGDLQALLAGETDLARLLERTVRILAGRFGAQALHLEVALEEDVHAARHLEPGAPASTLGSVGPELLTRARTAPDRVAREAVLADGVPFEALAASLVLPSGPAGGLVLLRPAPPAEDPADRFLLSLVPRALAVGLEAEVKRRDAASRAIRVATALLDALEGRGVLHSGHGERVERLADAMAQDLGLSARLREVVRLAARLHDVGAVGVPDAVLARRGPLSPPERELVRAHPVLGARILAPFGEAAAFVRHQHERPDGTGFPDGLLLDAIPIGAALIGCAEAYDAMTHHRAWRPSRSGREALAEIERLQGAQFAPVAVQALQHVVGLRRMAVS